MKEVILLIAAILCLSAISNCQTSQKDIFVLRGPYLGQDPPGIIPELFAPGIISSKDYVESNCLVWDNGRHIMVYRINVGTIEALMEGVIPGI